MLAPSGSMQDTLRSRLGRGCVSEGSLWQSSELAHPSVQSVQCAAATVAFTAALAMSFLQVIESKGVARVRIPLSPPSCCRCDFHRISASCNER